MLKSIISELLGSTVYAVSAEVNGENQADVRRVVGKQFKPKPGRCV